FVIQKVLVRRRAAGTLRENGNAPMICVLGPKGGTGKTVTSSNLAVALAQAGKSVSAIDLDLQFGDLALAMGVRPDKTMYDLVQSGGSLDAGKLDAYAMPHPSRVGIDDDDVLAVVGRRPDIRIPSDVEVPRAVNEGRPIVISKPDSAAAKGFRALADEFLRREGHGSVEPDVGEPERGDSPQRVRGLAGSLRSRNGNGNPPEEALGEP